MDPGDLVNELYTYVPKFPYRKAMLSLGGLRGTRKLYDVYRNTTLSKPYRSATRQDVQDMQIAQLRKAVLRNKPWVENTKISKSFNVIGTGVTVNNFSLTSELLGSSEFSYKTIGDVIRNIKIKYCSYNESLGFSNPQVATMRVVFYIPKDPGVYLNSLSLYDQAIIDPASFTVLSDRTYYPATSTDNKFPRGSVMLRNRLTKIDRTGVTSGTIRSGEVCVAIMTRGTSAATPQPGVYFEFQMFYQNK